MVTNTWGCADTILKALKIEADLSVYVPNVFTPNDDYLNDVFLPITRAVKSYELLIFDRWGAIVFSTTKVEQGWDGTYRGEPCKMDVYVWKINLSSVNGEMKTMTGNVMLSR
jgi:gliding motility-associated-like protein